MQACMQGESNEHLTGGVWYVEAGGFGVNSHGETSEACNQRLVSWDISKKQLRLLSWDGGSSPEG
jgi:hypothetical protein